MILKYVSDFSFARFIVFNPFLIYIWYCPQSSFPGNGEQFRRGHRNKSVKKRVSKIANDINRYYIDIYFFISKNPKIQCSIYYNKM